MQFFIPELDSKKMTELNCIEGNIQESLEARFLGLRDFAQMELLQQKLSLEILDSSKKRGILLGFESRPVVTLGKSLAESSGALAPSLASWPLIQTDRGGQFTLHSPGQLLVYPLVPLQLLWPESSTGSRVRDWICLLLQSTKAYLQSLNISAQTQASPGLFVGEHKICFLGLRIQKGISRHGISINICNDLSAFKNIIPCGVQGQKVTSISELNPKLASLSLEDHFQLWVRAFRDRIQLELQGRSCYRSKLEKRSLGAVGSAFP